MEATLCMRVSGGAGVGQARPDGKSQDPGRFDAYPLQGMRRLVNKSRIFRVLFPVRGPILYGRQAAFPRATLGCQ